MATGIIPNPTGGVSFTSYTPPEAAIDETLTFPDNNARHILITLYSSNPYCGVWIIKTASGGATSYTPILSASGMTITNGSSQSDTPRKMKFAHSGAVITYLDIAVIGGPLSFSYTPKPPDP